MKLSPGIPRNQGTPGFCMKHDGHHKARLVAGGHLTPDPIDSIYSAVVNRILKIINIRSQVEQHGSLGSKYWQFIPRSHYKKNYRST